MPTTGPNLGVKYGWADRESGWGDDMNDNLLLLDALAQAAVIDKDLTSPPGTPTLGDFYIVPSGASGAWSGHTNHLALWNGTAWVFYIPKEGYLVCVKDENKFYWFDGSAWQVTAII